MNEGVGFGIGEIKIKHMSRSGEIKRQLKGPIQQTEERGKTKCLLRTTRERPKENWLTNKSEGAPEN